MVDDRSKTLDPVPDALDTLLRELFPNPMLARRALLAPHPYLDFRSPYDDRGLWSVGGDPGRRQAWERVLGARANELTDPAAPFFQAPGTGGTLQSPYPELSDAEFWLYVDLWGGEEGARRWLERPMGELDGLSTVAWLARGREPRGTLAKIRDLFGKTPDPRRVAWDTHMERVAGNYR